MGRENLTNGKRCADVQNGDEALPNQAKAGAIPGDVTWVRLRGTSWWPAQVVDEKAVSDHVKPRKGKSGEVLVRLYGTYEYSYVDPSTSYLEFDNVLKQHKGSHKEIIEKAFKEDFAASQSRKSRRQSCKDKGKTKGENDNVVTKSTTEKQDGGKKKIRPNSPSSDVTPQKSGGSVRRLKVMQGLGLTAPSESPFVKTRQTLPILQ